MTDNATPTKGGGPSTTSNGKTPTSADAMFFYNIVKNMKSKADIDWAGVARDNNFKNAEVAKVRFGQVKRKLGIGENSTPAKTPAKATPTKAGDTNTADTKATPTKIKKIPTGRAGTKGKKAKKEAKEEDDNKVKMEDVQDSKVKNEQTEGEDPEAQLQADMDKYINQSPEPFF